ncbi:MAG: hypothetical protein K9L82_11000, partial [Chromatiaceae bacterium]|nr:hypothetical protein [Chromatiaceae bacterium]
MRTGASMTGVAWVKPCSRRSSAYSVSGRLPPALMTWWVAGPVTCSTESRKPRLALSLAKSTAMTTATPSAMPAIDSQVCQ